MLVEQICSPTLDEQKFYHRHFVHRSFFYLYTYCSACVQVLKENYGCNQKCTALADDMLKNQFIVGRNDVSERFVYAVLSVCTGLAMNT